MTRMKINSKLNQEIENVILKIKNFEKWHKRKIVYIAARRYNDRMYQKSVKKQK